MSVPVRASRLRGLGAVLGLLSVIFVVRGILGKLPREPRLYLVNRSGEEWHDPMIRSTCGDVVRIPALVEGQSIRLSLAPRSGCKYEIRYGTVDGDELLRLIEFSRKERADVEIVIDFHGCTEPDLTTRYRTWWSAD